jgi:hypothetical protein
MLLLWTRYTISDAKYFYVFFSTFHDRVIPKSNLKNKIFFAYFRSHLLMTIITMDTILQTLSSRHWIYIWNDLNLNKWDNELLWSKSEKRQLTSSSFHCHDLHTSCEMRFHSFNNQEEKSQNFIPRDIATLCSPRVDRKLMDATFRLSMEFLLLIAILTHIAKGDNMWKGRDTH